MADGQQGTVPVVEELDERVTLVHGDCYEVVGSLVAGAEHPVIVTDPPFNVGYGYDEYDDRKPEDRYYADLAEMFRRCPSVVIHYPESLYRIAAALGLAPDRVVSWVYNSNTPRQHRDIAYFGVKPDFTGLGDYKNPDDRRIAARIAQGKKPIGYDWLYVDQVKNVSKGYDDHPCQMPLKVMSYVVSTLPKDATVIDPFMGSGTTGMAAVQNGRRFIGVEISSHYYEMSRYRISNFMPLLGLMDGVSDTRGKEEQ